jgi:hypothetical protein
MAGKQRKVKSSNNPNELLIKNIFLIKKKRRG